MNYRRALLLCGFVIATFAAWLAANTCETPTVAGDAGPAAETGGADAR